MIVSDQFAVEPLMSKILELFKINVEGLGTVCY